MHIIITHECLYLSEVHKLKEKADYNLQFCDVLKQVN